MLVGDGDELLVEDGTDDWAEWMTLIDTTESVGGDDDVVMLELVVDGIGDWAEWTTVLDITESIDGDDVIVMLGLVVETEKRPDISNEDGFELLVEHAAASRFFRGAHAFVLLHDTTVEFWPFQRARGPTFRDQARLVI